MRKVLLVLFVLLFMCGSAYATTMPNRVSANTVTFSTVAYGAGRGPQVVTFNSVTKHIRLLNLSTVADCYADIRCIDANGKRGFCNSTCVILLPAIGKATPNTVEFDFATQNLGFIGNTVGSTTNGGVSGATQSVTYAVTGDLGDL